MSDGQRHTEIGQFGDVLANLIIQRQPVWAGEQPPGRRGELVRVAQLVSSTTFAVRAAYWNRDRICSETTVMATAPPTETTKITREKLIDKLNEDLAREYQAIIAYVVYSQVLKGAEYMAIAEELKVHASEELAHALTIAKQIDYLGGMPTVKALPVKQSDDAREMLRADLENENATIRSYRERIAQCEALQEYALGEEIREILRQEQEHQIDLATALGEDVPKL